MRKDIIFTEVNGSYKFVDKMIRLLESEGWKNDSMIKLNGNYYLANFSRCFK